MYDVIENSLTHTDAGWGEIFGFVTGMIERCLVSIGRRYGMDLPCILIKEKLDAGEETDESIGNLRQGMYHNLPSLDIGNYTGKHGWWLDIGEQWYLPLAIHYADLR